MTYTTERIHWSNRLQQLVPFRLSYVRTWIAERELWRDFLVRAEELGSAQEPDPIEKQASNLNTVVRDGVEGEAHLEEVQR